MNEFEIVEIKNKTEQQVARILRDSLVFLSFGFPEGFSLPPAEAMACGCIVIGYHGMGGAEFFHPEFSYPIAHGDIISFARTVELVIGVLREKPQLLTKKAKLASNYFRANYTLEMEKRDLQAIWSSIVKPGTDVLSWT